MGEDIALLPEHFDDAVPPFLDEYYQQYLAASEYGKTPPMDLLEQYWEAYLAEYPSVNPSLQRLEKLVKRLKRKKEDVEPEDIIAFAKSGDQAAIGPLRQYAITHLSEPPPDDMLPGVIWGPPILQNWVDVVCTYLQEGLDGLFRMALNQSEEKGRYAVSLLSDLGSTDSAVLVVRLLGEWIDGNHRLCFKCVDALNTLTVFQNVPLPQEQLELARGFLHKLLARPLEDHEANLIFCALRGVGNYESILVIKGRPALPHPYTGIEKRVIREITKRLA